jgi:AcrR family transcriptional regulator
VSTHSFSLDGVESKRERARPLSPEERRAAIIRATRPLLMEHGRRTTTRLVAEAAGVAEGTIFRVFPTKDELFDAVLDAEFDPEPFLAAVGRIDLDLPLRDRMVAVTTILQRRFMSIFQLMIALSVPKPPERLRRHELRHKLATEGMITVLKPDADRFRVPPEEVVRLLRLLTFSGSHPHISDPRRLEPEEIVDVILHGVLVEEGD